VVRILGGRRILEEEDGSVRMRTRAKVVKEPSTLRLLGVLVLGMGMFNDTT
jgi:hypothetical protein